MVLAVDLQHDADASWQQHQEVHALAQQGVWTSLPDGPRIVVQPDLGYQCGQAGHLLLVVLEEGLEQ